MPPAFLTSGFSSILTCRASVSGLPYRGTAHRRCREFPAAERKIRKGFSGNKGMDNVFDVFIVYGKV